MNIAIIAALRAFYRTKWLAKPLATRDDIAAWRQKRLGIFLRHDIGRVPFYRTYRTGKFSDLPVMDKATLRRCCMRRVRVGDRHASGVYLTLTDTGIPRRVIRFRTSQAILASVC